MADEIERKFLVKGDAWRSLATGIPYCQGYIASTEGRTVRIRVVGELGYLTLKGATTGISRAEFEYPIPLNDALELLETLCDRPLIQKRRYKIEYAGLIWEMDEFEGDNQGLIVAEVELTNVEQTIALPAWIDREVSDDPHYFNSNLAKHPFSQWEK